MERKKIRRKRFKTFRLSDIEELDFLIWTCRPKVAPDLKRRICEEGGRVVLSMDARGVSRRPLLQVLGVVSDDREAIFAICRSEDAGIIIEKLGMEFGFDKPGNGKAFAVPVDGFLGGKGLFMEVV